LKARIPIFHYEHGYSVKKICLLLDVKKSMVYQTLAYHRTYGVAYNPHRRASHRRRILLPPDVEFIRSLLSQQHTLYLDEIQTELQLRRNVHVSIPTIVRTLRRIHFSSKSISVKALERNETARAAFMNRIGQLVTDMDMVMFTDESAKDARNVGRMKGYSLVGTRCVQRRCFVRGKRYSILPILTLDGIIAYDIIEGSVTSDRFVRFLKEMVIPLTNPYPGPRSVLILDNCRIHHSEEVRHLVEDMAKCKLIFLPPYSPDYNPIEQAFSCIKAWLRRHTLESGVFSIVKALQVVTPQKALGWFCASGYM